MTDRKMTTQKERGQALILTVLAMVVLVGFTAMAIDVGLLFEDRRHLQNTADAAALAGAAELPLNPVSARLKAEEWAANNGIPQSQIKTIEIRTTDFPNDTIYVEVDENFNWVFGRVLGMTSSTVSADAAAQTGSLIGGHPIMPWALQETDTICLDGSGNAIFGRTCTVKVGAGSGISGWYGALDLDGIGGGSNEYENNIIDGEADTYYCIWNQSESPCEASQVHDLDGNKVGGTGHGIDERLARGGCDPDGTDEFEDVYKDNPSPPPTYSVACPDSPWLMIIPIVSLDGDPVQTVTIEGWILGYFEGYSCVGGSAGNCTAKGHWEVQIRIVDATYSQAEGFLGAFDATSGIVVRRLIE